MIDSSGTEWDSEAHFKKLVAMQLSRGAGLFTLCTAENISRLRGCSRWSRARLKAELHALFQIHETDNLLRIWRNIYCWFSFTCSEIKLLLKLMSFDWVGGACNLYSKKQAPEELRTSYG